MILAIRGKIGAGKDTAARFILEYLYEKKYPNHPLKASNCFTSLLEEQTDFQIKKFAYKVKLFASLLLNEPVEQFEDPEFKKTKLGTEWNEMTVRDFLIKLATEGLRDNLHRDVWINGLFCDYKARKLNKWDKVLQESIDCEEDFPNWIVTDMRFKNEYERLEEKGAILIEVQRNNNPNPLIDHPSETELDGYEFHHTLTNPGTTLEEYRDVVFELCKKLNL